MLKGTIRALFGNWSSTTKTILLAIPAVYLLRTPASLVAKKIWAILNLAAPQTISYDIGIGIATNLVSAFILAAAAVFWYKTAPRFRLNGKYRVEILTPQAQSFGEVYLLVSPFSLASYGVHAKLSLIDTTQSPSMKLEGLATIINGTFLVGHYAESLSNLRRRCGTFFYTLDGTGKIFSGPFTYIDPATGQQTHGTAQWVRAD